MNQKSAVAGSTAPGVPMTAEQRAAFDRGGYLIIGGALGPDETAAAREAIDRVYATEARAGSLGPDGSMHLLSAVTNCPQVAGLTDHPATFGCVWSVLGWNIHIYHSHLDVHPPVRGHMPLRFDLHQDGGNGRAHDRYRKDAHAERRVTARPTAGSACGAYACAIRTWSGFRSLPT